MAGKYLCVRLHFIWSTKERIRLIKPEWSSRLRAYLGSILKFKKAKLIEGNCEPDHVHLYVSMPSTISIAELINSCKSNSSRWINQNFFRQKLFSWQEGYAAFSVSPSREKSVIEYIQNQKKHHRRMDFQQELLEIFDHHNIEYDSKYLWN